MHAFVAARTVEEYLTVADLEIGMKNINIEFDFGYRFSSISIFYPFEIPIAVNFNFGNRFFFSISI